MIGMLQQTATFNGASLKFERRFADRPCVKLVAMLQGSDTRRCRHHGQGVVPFAMMQFQMGELAGTITPAVNAYLDDPEEHRDHGDAAAPVTFAKISEVSMATPGDSAATTNAIWSLLGITVNANK